MLHITTEVPEGTELVGKVGNKKHSLKQHLLEKMKTWINGLLEGERDEFLGRGRHVVLDESHDNYRNGYRPRRINFFRIGRNRAESPTRSPRGVHLAVAAGEKRPRCGVGSLLSRSFSGGTVDPGPSADIGEAPGAPVRFQADLADCGAGHDGTRGLAPALLARPAL